ncbi:MAG TPA: PHP domain-containing protein [Armatimonadota bacterium]|nr:PHP domain-containing protein [Armatimonadota bacterium]HPP73715.1 PHP domain-containing protein [Armatimonadota bacterium]
MIVVLHIHSDYSACSESHIDKIAQYCRQHDIKAIGLTDHDTIEGALRLQKEALDLKVIVGEEISTSHGEIVGLFLKEKIEPNQDLRETCLEIKKQGGVVYVPHPFDRLKVNRIRARHLREILDLVDVIEIYNSKISLAHYNTRAKRFADKHHKLGAVGSDSHYVASIGAALNIMEPFEGPQDFLEKLSRAEFKTGASSLLSTWWVRVRKSVKSKMKSFRGEMFS